MSINEFSPWLASLSIYLDYLNGGAKLHFNKLNEISSDFRQRAGVEFTVLGAVKHQALLNACLQKCFRRLPSKKLKAYLILCAGVLLESENKYEKIADDAVEHAKKVFSAPEVRFINVILRQLRAILGNSEKIFLNNLEILYSHPEWLIHHWAKNFGNDNLEKLLKFNQSKRILYARCLSTNCLKVSGLKSTSWPNFYIVNDFSLLGDDLFAKNIYIQDPMTRIPVELLDVAANQDVLELCASPGGKSLQIVEKLGSGRLVALDLPNRQARLKENLGHFPNVCCVAADWLKFSKAEFDHLNLPIEYDRILLDVPCSNTGVLRRRPDVKWRLTPNDFENLPVLQLLMLKKAAEYVKVGGKMVYSTCSIEPEENEAVVQRFLEGNRNFTNEVSHMSYPWSTDYDGGGAFSLKRVY